MCFFNIIEVEVSFTVGVHADDIIVPSEKDACRKFLAQLEEWFPVKHRGELLFVRDWESGVRGMNQTATTEILVVQYEFYATANIPSGPAVDLGPWKDGERGGNEGLPPVPDSNW